MIHDSLFTEDHSLSIFMINLQRHHSLASLMDREGKGSGEVLQCFHIPSYLVYFPLILGPVTLEYEDRHVTPLMETF